MSGQPPDFWLSLRQELRAGRHWVDRAIVLACAVATGATVVGFTLLAEGASDLFQALRALDPWGAREAGNGLALGVGLSLLWTPLLTVAVVAWCRRFAPAAAGSGIPQVMCALDDERPDARPERWASLRLALHKIGLVSGGLLGGLSIGREGPTVQIGAGVMLHARRWLSPSAGIDAHDLMVAGAAAGIAAAFNTPLGGIVFAFEQLSRRRGLTHSTLVIACIVLAGLVAVSAFGNLTYFGRLPVGALDLSLLGPGLLVALVAGLAGGLLSRLVVLSLRAGPQRWARWRREHPLRFAAACGAGVALIGAVTGGATAGAGYATTRGLLEGQVDLPGVYTLLKFVATWLSVWSGAPGGMFATSLAIGAGIGHDVASLAGVGTQAAIPLIAVGMVGFLAASTQNPITAFIIVMEMVAGQTMVLSLMATALLSSGVSRLLTQPLYGELAALAVAGLPPAAGPDTVAAAPAGAAAGAPAAAGHALAAPGADRPDGVRDPGRTPPVDPFHGGR
ncbi:chloride channel protein [Piscinibacter sakaiensis]|uniref:Chloride channel protein n=1 Tax=Piscinibacter sakaiensis TaxID=1547922 RepID=A0A0K8P3A2_PISS1|nr:chloride channel protein [Piscinibacter sakaiensis]GAP37093.1 chloride channel protein [Piscinibacter sakaiensis]